jgi:hypothetical protein
MKTYIVTMSKSLLLLALLLMSLPLFAARVGGLYEAEVPVAGQETAQRNQAIIAAFKEVLVKVTGSRGTLRQPRLASDIAEAPRYVQQYRYRLQPVETVLQPPAEEQPQQPDGEPPQPPAVEGIEPEPVAPERMLRVRFDEDAVNRLLRQRGLPVWGETRPAILLWLTTEQDRRRTMLVPEAEADTLNAVFGVADQRGMPLLFPLMDLEDQSRLHISDVWGGFADNIRQASERYGPDAIITGRLIQFAPDLWRASWTLYLDGDSLIWDSEGDSLAMAAEAGTQAGIDMLASRFALATGGGVGADRTIVRISGVGDLSAYARVSRYLREQAGVEELELVLTEADALVYSIQVRGGRKALEQGIALSGILQPIFLEEGGGALLDQSSDVMGVTLHYQLQP